MRDIKIRLATLDDADDISRVHARSWEFAYGWFLGEEIIAKQNERVPSMWRMILENSKDSYAVEVDGKIVGLIGLNVPSDTDLPEGCFELQGLYLLPEFIGKGYGRHAMEWTLREANERGYKYVCLWVFEKNERARRFYEKCGFVLDENAEQKVYGERALRYSRALN